LIRVEDYHKSYRETVAVAGLSFHVPAGVILGLVGPNLIHPMRIVPSKSADFQFFDRTRLFVLLQMLILLPSLGVPAGFWGIAFWISGFSWPVFAVTTWLVLLAELPPLMMLLAWTFNRFDPSTQTLA